ncbi:hypothetical protein [Streptomyces sp. NPDC048445]|uniref:hypothetical protein n=1 Tax=Streptomyces sp. NPDC048445 TaxID=3365553 RepID=UPI00371BDCAB
MADWKRKLNQARAHLDEPPAEVLMPATRGQVPLFTLPRTLTATTVRVIADRPVSGWGRAREELVALAGEHGFNRGWYYRVAEMVRLALAVREAEGTDLLPEAFLRELPGRGDAVRVILLRAGLLAEASEPLRFYRADQPSTPYITVPAPRPPLTPRQCRDCHAWIPGGWRGFRCNPCRHWREKYARSRCLRCRRDDLPLRGGHCRGCYPYRLLDEAGSHPAATQLQIDLPARTTGGVHPLIGDQPLRGADRTATLHAARGQETLFDTRRDWSPVLARLGRRGPDEMPLSEEARLLVEEFDQLILDRRTPDYRKNIRTLAILVHWLGAENAILERDVHDLASCSATLAAKPVCQFLRSHGLLIDDPDRRQDVNLARIQAAISVLPDPLASEIHAWVTLLRSQGRREGEARDYRSIRRYLAHIEPVLTTWTAAGVTTLRKITTDHIETVVADLSGRERQQVAGSLRSLFKALKRERMVFRDSTRQLSVGHLKSLPQSVRSDLLAGLMDHAKSPLSRLVIALVAVHALPGEDLRTIRTADLNLARGTLEVRRGLLRHTLYLEEFTHRLAGEWLTYRHHRWPASTNPYLLVSQKTALDPDHPVVSRTLLRKTLPKNVTLVGLRQDRILNEAFATGDPLKLMRLFGITAQTAMRYVGAACPERTAKLPR